MKDIGTMLQQIDGLRGTKDVNQWESDFIESCMETSQNDKITSHLSSKQVEIVERIWRRHFA